MAINIDAIRAKLGELQSTTKRQNNLWKPKPGENIVRIVPYIHQKENPFMELLFHYDLGRKNYCSPATFGEPDPVVDFAQQLQQTGEREDWIMGKKLEPKMRTYVPILVRGEESEGVKFWGFGKTVYQEILGFIADPDYGDITDPVNGRDIVVEFEPAKGPGTYPKTRIRVKPNQTPCTEDKAVMGLLKEQPKLGEDVFPIADYDELKSALESYLDGSDEDESGNTSSATTESQRTPAHATETYVSTDDIASQFDDLMG